MSDFEIYPHEGATVVTHLDEDEDDGTWIVWRHPFYVAREMDEKRAKELTDILNLVEELTRDL